MWIPQRGPQLAALEAGWCDELFYGGSRGGGKSDFQLGYQEHGALTYADGHRGIMFRKTYPELEELQARAIELFPKEGAVYKVQNSADYPFSNCWYWPSGATVKMRYIEREADYGRYHGHQYCVAVDTPVLMADGSWREIAAIVPGDMVMTLEGPRQVLATVEPYVAPCVRMTVFDSAGAVTGAQVHPVWHPVLTSVSVACESRRDECRTDGQLRPSSECWQSAESLTCAARTSQGGGAFPAGSRTDCEAFADARRDGLQPVRLSCPVVLYAPVVHPDGHRSATGHCDRCICAGLFAATRQSETTLWRKGLRRLAERLAQVPGCARIAPHVARCVRATYGRLGFVSAPNWIAGCLSGCRFGDEPLRSVQAGGRCCARLQDDAATQVRDGKHADEMDCTPEHSLREPYTYTHPYTKEQRPGSVPVVQGTATMVSAGAALVCDLTIEHTNHYITKAGLVNKNTRISFDEVTEYATPNGLLKMLSTLRSAKGVPCSVRLTGNPGGVGHIWVKNRYIDPVAPYTPYTDPETGFVRMYIPSRMQDNPALLASDPNYMRRVLASTAGNEALRQAWIEGRWDIVAGAFFEALDRAKHALRPFRIPDDWLRFRAFDWGSARPFSVGWYAVVGNTCQVQGRTLPRGALVRYREWYGAKEPNVGLKLSAEAVAEGIAERERGETIAFGKADPSIWKVDGGPSIAERMANRGVHWLPADNARLNGWDQMRQRIVGEDDAPMLFVTEDCAHWWRTVPLMQHDTSRIEDIDTDMEDHAADETRYACMARPWIPAQRIEVAPSAAIAAMPKVADLMRPTVAKGW